MGRLDALDEMDERTLGPENESAAQRKKRMRSIRIAHIGMFIFGLGFSIVITGVYPYMLELFPDEPTSTLLNEYGFVVSVNPLGQLLFSPVFGFLANRLRSIRLITLAACVTYISGNVIYSLLSLFAYDLRYPMLLLCRFMVGISTGMALVDATQGLVLREVSGMVQGDTGGCEKAFVGHLSYVPPTK